MVGHDASVFACAWSPDGTRIATASRDSTVSPVASTSFGVNDHKVLCKHGIRPGKARYDPRHLV